jgi:hypothetical protein
MIRRYRWFLILSPIIIGALIFSDAHSQATALDIPPPGLMELLMPNQSVVRAVWEEDTHFVFEGQVGEVITISVKSKTPGLDPHVLLLDPEKKEEASMTTAAAMVTASLKITG